MQSPDFDIRNRKRFYFHATPLRRLVVFLARWVFRLFMKLEVSGLENLPREGAAIVAANHVTSFDVFPMQLSLPRPIFFMGKAELFRWPVLEAVYRNMGAFPVFRGEKDQWAIEHAGRVLANGQILGMFPEGTRSQGKGLAVAKTGSARLALEAGCPIVPMAIAGSDEFFRHFPRRTRVTVRLLPPLAPTADDTPITLTERVMFALASALPEEKRGVYASLPEGFKI
jgi:1-acyl-sn-glycerol-3-phosphate acyltransferase